MSVSLSEKDALVFLRSWQPASDVYAFHYGHSVLTATTAASAIFINRRFRKAFKLRNFAFISTYGAAMFIPAVTSAFLHGMLVVRPMLSRQVQCPVRLETRGSLTQVVSSVVYPVILSPLACIPFADRYMTMAVPSITQQPLLVLKQISNILKPISKRLLIIAVVQAIIGGAVTHWELSNIFTVVEKVEAMEKLVSATVPEDRMQQIKEESLHEDLEALLKPDKPIHKYIFSVD